MIRAKSDLKYRRVYFHSVEKAAGLIGDQTVQFAGFYQTKDYPDKLLRNE